MQFISDQAICCILSSHILISFIAESHLYDKTDILLEWVNTNDKGCNSLSRYIKNCGYYHDFLHKGLLLTRKLLRQGLLVVKLKSSLRNNECRHHELVNRCGLSVSQMIMKMFRLSQSHSGHLSFMTFTGFETRVTRRVAHVQHPSSLSFFLICLSGFVLLLLSNWCFIPCCDLTCVWFYVLLMKYDCLHIYWRPARYSYQMMFESLKRNTPGISCGAGTQLSLSGYPSSPSICRRVRVSWPLVFCIMFCRPLIIILSFFYGHCIVCPSSYDFWLSLWYPQTFYVKTIVSFYLFFFALFFQFFDCRSACPFCLLYC